MQQTTSAELSDEVRKKLERNIRLMPWFSAVCLLLFVQPIKIIFFQTKGVSPAEFFMLQPFIAIFIIFFEMPLSYLSDRSKRTNLIRIACLFSIAGTIIVWQAQSFWYLAPFTFMYAMAVCFKGSSESALTYETLVALGREDEHKKILGKVKAYGAYSLAFAAITGGFMYSFNIEYPSMLALTACSLSFILSLFLHEAPRIKRSSEKHPIKDMLDVAKYTLKGHAELKWIILFASTISMAEVKGFWTLQLILSELGIASVAVGVAICIFRFIKGFAGQMAHKFEHTVPLNTLTLFCVVLAAGNFIFGGLDFGYWVVLPLLLVAISEGVAHIISQDMIQERTSSDIRATVLSVNNMMGRLQYAIITPLFGVAMDLISLKFAMFSIAAIILTFAGVAAFMIRKNFTS